MRPCAILTLAALAAVVLPVHATTHIVDLGGGGDYTEIGTAAAFADEGDTILVYPGTYTGQNNSSIGGNGTNLVFIAENGLRDLVIIDCEGEGRAFYIYQGEDASTIIRGFTIQNASDSAGGGMRISNCSPIIEDCTFINNSTYQNGGAIAFYSSGARVQDCTFRGNNASGGGAVYCNDSSVLITRCLFDENTLSSAGTGGGALYCYQSAATITLCTIVENGLDQIQLHADIGTNVSHCIIANGTDGVGIGELAEGTATATRCVISGNPGGDVPECDHDEIIYQDPLFCDDEADDYTLCDNSTAVDYNNIWTEQIGAYGSGCPECESPVEVTTWGVVKALFR